jgi:outer membrane murein-binding lipoprotein Lpp
VGRTIWPGTSRVRTIAPMPTLRDRMWDKRLLQTVTAFALLPGVIVIATAVVGCSGDRDGTAKRLKELQDSVTRLENRNDRLEEQLTALELSREVAGQNTARTEGNADTLERPPLKIVRMGPGAPA